jgi:hypothetical protein
MSNSAHFLVPAARFLRPGFAFCSLTPKSTGGGAPAGASSSLCRALIGASVAARLSAARTFACANARSPFGAPPWQGSGLRGPEPSEAGVFYAPPGTPLLASPSGSSLEDAPHARGCESSTVDAYRSQEINSKCDHYFRCQALDPPLVVDGEFASHSSTYAGTGTVRYTW